MALKVQIPDIIIQLLFFTICLLLIVSNAVAGTSSLQQIVILGRHNLRTPLSESLQRFTTNKWPKWDQPPGYLTQKGGLLESYMGKYFNEWMEYEGLLNKDCPERNVTVHVYSNWPQRTRETARQFVKTAFRQCSNITVHHVEGKLDPNFQPVIHNSTEEFRTAASEEIQEVMEELDLRDAYTILNEVLDLNNSDICKKEGLCDLNRGNNSIILEYGDEPEIDGPLKFGNQIVDTFLMEFYDKKSDKDIAWGRIPPVDFNILSKLTEASQRLRFSCPIVTRDVAKPMTENIANIFLNTTHNITVLVGHDSTITAVLANLKFKSYKLPKQYEKTPIGGKVVFQKRFENGRYYLKIEYVYQTTEQLRNGTKLSLENPPKSHTLELVNCVVNENGMCPWEDFTKILLEKVDNNTV